LNFLKGFFLLQSNSKFKRIYTSCAEKTCKLDNSKFTLTLKRLGIDTYKEAVVYVRADSPICKAEGFASQARIKVCLKNNRSIIATVHTITSNLLELDEVSLSNYAWNLLKAKSNEKISLSHMAPLQSMQFIRGKIFNKPLSEQAIDLIIKDVIAGRLSDIHISAFLTICADGRLSKDETIYLTRAMAESGDKLNWQTKSLAVDKHCIGGLPGNRTTPIIVAIVAAFGLMIPKTSSRAVTSSAGTADTMEVLTDVNLSLKKIKEVVLKENGCVAWGGSIPISPADDILITVERALDLDSFGQLIASVLSKKIAAGSTHIVIDIPVGKTAKIRTLLDAEYLAKLFKIVADALGVNVKVIVTDGSQPVGFGIGPALEARDIMAVLKNESSAPSDLRERALELAGHVLEFSSKVPKNHGKNIATEILQSGKALKKFIAICNAQGKLRKIKFAKFQKEYLAVKDGYVKDVDNRKIARLAKLAGAPYAKAAGIDLHKKIGDKVNINDKILTLHADSEGELLYAWNFLTTEANIIEINDE